MKLPQSVRAYAMANIKKYPTLYGHENIDHGILATLGHLYFTLGNGINWEKGKPKRRRPNKWERNLDAVKFPKEVEDHRPSYVPTPYCGAAYIQQLPENMNTNWLKGYIWCLAHYLANSLSGKYEGENAYYSPNYMQDFVYRELKTREAFEERLRVLLTEAYSELESRG